MSKTATKTKTIAYQRYAIATVFNTYYSMKEFGERVCEYLKGYDKDLHVSDVRESAVALKKSRGAAIANDDVADAIVIAIRSLTEDNTRFETHISDVYDFDYETKLVDRDFVDDVWSIHSSGRNIYIDAEA